MFLFVWFSTVTIINIIDGKNDVSCIPAAVTQQQHNTYHICDSICPSSRAVDNITRSYSPVRCDDLCDSLSAVGVVLRDDIRNRTSFDHLCGNRRKITTFVKIAITE